MPAVATQSRWALGQLQQNGGRRHSNMQIHPKVGLPNRDAGGACQLELSPAAGLCGS